MSRKNKIIVSIVGITIVLLALLGLTYAYYLTRIQGNTNTTSISITTADLKLEYSEGEDSNISLTGLMPGEDIPAKTFTVTNSGNNKVDDYVVALIDVVNTLSRTGDLTYTLSCVQKNEDGVVTGTCNGVDVLSTEASDGKKYGPSYPIKNSMIITNSIEAGYSHEYSLKLNYRNFEDEDQSDDMGSTIKGKVQIYGLADTIDLTGTVTGSETGDYVQINSEQMTSQIVNGTYKLVGIEPGVHSLKIMDKDGVKKTEKYIQINNGETASVTTGEIELEDESTVNGPIITMTSLSRSTTININKTTSEYIPTEEFTDYTPPMSESEKTLAALGLTLSSGTPDFSKTSCSSGCEESTVGIYAAEDNYGTSYYFRGDVTNNYVKFGTYPEEEVYCFEDGDGVPICYYGYDDCLTEYNNYDEPVRECYKNTSFSFSNKSIYWRIIRINGDGTLRLIYDGTEKYANGISNTDRGIRFYKQYPYFEAGFDDIYWYKTLFNDTNLSNNIADTIFCQDDDIYEEKCAVEYDDCYIDESTCEYDEATGDEYNCKEICEKVCAEYEIVYKTDKRLQETSKTPTLECSADNIRTVSNKKLIYPFDDITADELSFAGGVYNINNANYYLNKGIEYITSTPHGGNSEGYLKDYVEFSGKIFWMYNEDNGGGGTGTNFYNAPVINLTKEYARTLKLNSDGVYISTN